MDSVNEISENKGSMWDLDQKLDQPMDEEAGKLKNAYREKKFSALLLLRLAYQSLGVVYGDLGTSPLYVFYNTFPHGVENPDDVIGALSLIIYSLTLVPLLKYVFIVCRANDNGQGESRGLLEQALVRALKCSFEQADQKGHVLLLWSARSSMLCAHSSRLLDQGSDYSVSGARSRH